jgi:choline dehydrogenase-like flavoprotein
MHINLEEDKLILDKKIIKLHKLYDYIVIGSGPAASVVLNNLIKKKKKILVVERGGFKKKFG